MIVNKAELADAVGVSLTTVDKWIPKGCPVKQRGGRGVSWEFELAEVIQWLTDRNTGESADLAKERALLAKAQRQKVTLEIKRLTQEFVPVDAVIAVWSDIILSARNSLLSLPSRITPMVAHETEHSRISGIIKEEIYAVLNNLAEQPEYSHEKTSDYVDQAYKRLEDELNAEK